MTLEELKAIWDKAIADAAAKPEDKELAAAVVAAEKVFTDAKAAADADPDPVDPELDDSKLDPKTKAYLAKLRKENASHRNKNKDLVSKVQTVEQRNKAILKAAGLLDEEKPEEKLANAAATNNQQAFEILILKSSRAHKIPDENLEFYEYLMAKAFNALEEGDELSEEDLAAIVTKCKGGAGKSATSTVLRFDKDGKPIKEAGPGESGQMTLDKFCEMSITEKSKLYLESPEVYETFFKAAKAKGRAV
jgi:hypothetical protein